MKKTMKISAMILIAATFAISCGDNSGGSTPKKTVGVPTLTTGQVTDITLTGATVSGEVLADSNAAVTEKGICYAITTSPTISDGKIANGSGLGAITAVVTGLASGTKYYARAYATNSKGTSYGSEVTFTTLERTYVLGESYGGGIVIYVDNSEKHGLIVADTNLGVAGWGCPGTAITGAVGTSIMDGIQNTKDILAGCNEVGYAAKIISNLNYKGFSDWHMPSKDALTTLHAKFVSQGKTTLTKGRYWASSQNKNNKENQAQTINVGVDGVGQYEDKSIALSTKIVAVRAF